jgi:hypothetical protein
MLPIFVINCAADTHRRESFERAAKGMDVHFIDAVDARQGAGVFKPYVSMLREKFWLDDDIKPGAFGCFISHRLAWQRMVDENITVALIAEDDSVLSHVEKSDFAGRDLTFVNDRAVGWVPTGVLNDIVTSPNTSAARGFGGDGYVLTLHGAQALLAQSEIDGVCCGVDWYLAYAGMDTQNLKHVDVKGVSEIKRLWKILGPRAPLMRVGIAPKPWLVNARDHDSTIKHSHRIDICMFRQAIENA